MLELALAGVELVGDLEILRLLANLDAGLVVGLSEGTPRGELRRDDADRPVTLILLEAVSDDGWSGEGGTTCWVGVRVQGAQARQAAWGSATGVRGVCCAGGQGWCALCQAEAVLVRDGA